MSLTIFVTYTLQPITWSSTRQTADHDGGEWHHMIAGDGHDDHRERTQTQALVYQLSL